MNNEQNAAYPNPNPKASLDNPYHVKRNGQLDVTSETGRTLTRTLRV